VAIDGYKEDEERYAKIRTEMNEKKRLEAEQKKIENCKEIPVLSGKAYSIL